MSDKKRYEFDKNLAEFLGIDLNKIQSINYSDINPVKVTIGGKNIDATNVTITVNIFDLFSLKSHEELIIMLSEAEASEDYELCIKIRDYISTHSS